MSVSSAGIEGNAQSFEPAISADGRYVAFSSLASNLVVGDTNGMADIFVRDRVTHATDRVSLGYSASISADGRYVAFGSEASNLVADDANGTNDVFVRDRTEDTTVRVSVSSAGIEGNAQSFEPAISADGRYVAFSSVATNLVGDDTNAAVDIFVHDLMTHRTKRVSISSAGIEGRKRSFGPSISDDGRYIAFWSLAYNLVGNDTNRVADVFVRDRTNHKTKRVSISSAGVQADGASQYPSLSADGRYVAFGSQASDLIAGDTNDESDVFVRDRTEKTTERVSTSSAGVQGDDFSAFPSISADGRYVAFYSRAGTLVDDDTNGWYDVFVRDRTEETTARVSVGSGGVEGNGSSWKPAISADGRYVAFESDASNLVPDDTNGGADVFRRGPLD